MDGCETPRSIWSRNARNIMVGECDLCKPYCRPCKSNAVGSPGALLLVSRRPYRDHQMQFSGWAKRDLPARYARIERWEPDWIDLVNSAPWRNVTSTSFSPSRSILVRCSSVPNWRTRLATRVSSLASSVVG